MAKKVKNETKVKLSNNAHFRLMKRAQKSKREDVNFIVGNYHSSVIKKQKELGRVLTAEERKKEYNSCCFFYYN